MNTSRKTVECLFCFSIVNLMFGCLLFKIFNMSEMRRLKNVIFIQIIFLLFQTKLNKAVNIFGRPPEWIRNLQMIPGFSTVKTWVRILNG